MKNCQREISIEINVVLDVNLGSANKRAAAAAAVAGVFYAAKMSVSALLPSVALRVLLASTAARFEMCVGVRFSAKSMYRATNSQFKLKAAAGYLI